MTPSALAPGRTSPAPATARHNGNRTPPAARFPVPGIFLEMLERADIRIGGTRPWDIQLHDARLFGRILGAGSLGLGEAYMEGWWDCDALDEFFARLLLARKGFRPKPNARLLLFALKARLV